MARESFLKRRARETQGKVLAPADPNVARSGDIEVPLTGNLPNYTAGYQLTPDSPNQLANYDRLSRGERWVMDRLAGFADTKVGRALEGFNEKWYGKALMLLDVPAEAVERGIGVYAQALQLGPIEEMDVAAAWYAGSLWADLSNIPTWDKDGGLLSVPLDLPGIDGVVRARKRISELVRGGMEYGDALVVARDEIYNDLGALQLRSQLQDTFIHIAGDPLNLLMAYLKPIELAQGALMTARIGKAVPSFADDAIDVLNAAIKVSDNADEIARLQRTINTIGDINRLNPFEEKTLKMLGAFPPDKPITKWSKLNPFGLTPESRALEAGTKIHDYLISQIVTDPKKSPLEIARAFERIADGTVSPELAHMIVSVEGRQVTAVSRRAAIEASQYAKAWQATSTQRAMLNDVALALGDDVYDVWRMANGDEALELATRIQESVPDLFESLTQYAAKNSYQDVGELLGDTAKVFGDTPLLDDSVFRALLMDSIDSGIAELMVAKYGVEARGFAVKLSNAVKSAENIAFLGLNPGYLARNTVNNEVTMLARGAWSWSREAGEAFWRETMQFEPARLRVGYGAAGTLLGDVAKGPMEGAQTVIKGAAVGERNVLDRVAGFFNDINLGPLDMRKHAGSVEASGSFRATTSGTMRWYKKAWPKIYAEEASLKNFPEVYNAVARELGDDAVRSLDDTMRELRVVDDVDNVLYNAADMPAQKSVVLDDASSQIGKDISTIMEAEEVEPILDDMFAALDEGGTTRLGEVTEARKAQIRADTAEMVTEETRHLQQQSMNRTVAEGVGAVPREIADGMDDFWATGHTTGALENARIMDMFRELQDVDRTLAGKFLENARVEQRRYWTGEFGKIKARVNGLKAGFKQIEKQTGQSWEPLNKVTGLVDEWEGGWKEVFKLKDKLRKDYFDRLYAGKSKKMGFEFIQKQIDDSYRIMAAKEDDIMRAIDDAVLAYVPDQQRTLYRAYRETVHGFRAKDRNMVIDFFDEPLGDGRGFYDLSQAEQTAAYDELVQLRMGTWREIAEAEQAAATGNYQRFTREATELSKAHQEKVAKQLALPLEEGVEVAAEAAEEAVDTFNVSGVPDYFAFTERLRPDATIKSQVWTRYGNELMDSLHDSVIRASERKVPQIANLTPETQQALRGFADNLKNKIGSGRYQSVKFGEWMRDSALLNYQRRLNYDTFLGVFFPYEFWFTHSAQKWALHTIDRPFVATTYLRMQKMLETGYRPDSGLPARLKGTIRIPVPFLPKWLGNEVFVDPMNLILPFKQWAYPQQLMAQQQAGDIGSTKRVLEEMLNDGTINSREYQMASDAQTGPVWERAVALARRDDTEGRLSGFDLTTALMSPHAPIMWAYHMARGEPEKIQPFMPLTRNVKGVTALLGISPNTGGLNIEGAVRKAMGLPAFDQWDDYRVERMLTSMAATQEISFDEFKQAITNKSTDIYKEAVRRAGIEYGVTAMGSITGLPLKAYPEGEEHQRKLKDDYEAAWADYELGNTSAIDEFYEEHPEYEARLALFKSPEERMQTFLVDEIWDRWNDMPTIHKNQLKDELGELFSDAFLSRDTRDIESIPPETMAVWLKIMGGDPPGMVHYEETLTPIHFVDKDKAYRLDAFYETREKNFRYYGQIAPLWDEYFKLDDSARRQYWRDNPILGQYVGWRDDFMYRNPDLAPYIEDDPDKLPQYKSLEELQSVSAQQPNFSQMEWQSLLGVEAYRLIQDSEPLPDAVKEVLSNLGISREQVLQNQ